MVSNLAVELARLLLEAELEEIKEAAAASMDSGAATQQKGLVMVELDRLSLQDGNILLDDSLLYIGNNKLFEFYQHNDNVYVIGENNTFLQIHKTYLVEVVPWWSEAFSICQKHMLRNEVTNEST